MEDHQFTLFTGYKCLLPDLSLFVELRQTGWTATAYEPATKGFIMSADVRDSESGKQHCTLFVNSFRAAFRESKHKPLTSPLTWEVYGNLP